ncbi:MAG TPA: alpha/beta hydrolase-fold protein [Gaiellaceae bacterium]|jgi:enterochelin esterase-like enzyme|nr:alpha/beta hydrolase-fold protein [Gaiellaceae bacterium]
MLAAGLAALALLAPAPGWYAVAKGPAGGAVWEGRIPDQFVHADRRPSAVYLPPGYDPAHRYPAIYLLHGMRGSPASFWSGLHFARVADGLIASRRVRPFIAVMPVAGPRVNPDAGEWAGVWEDYTVRDVVPWVDRHLRTVASPAGRALEGLCAGGYGAVDIGLRHPGIFGTLGSWEGYFAPVFRDGPFVHATRAYLAAHDPALLVRRDARALDRDGVRFYISAGGNHAGVLGRWSVSFARELGSLRLQHDLWLLPRAERGHFWRATLPSALEYAAAAFR